jgi:hypothetical protein
MTIGDAELNGLRSQFTVFKVALNCIRLWNQCKQNSETKREDWSKRMKTQN